MPIEITVNQNQLRDIDIMLAGVRDGNKLAMFSAVQRTASTAKTRIGRLVRAELNLKKKDADKTVYVTRRATKEQPIAGIRISGRLISLRRFGAKQLKRRGVVATTFRSKGRQSFPHSFEMKNTGAFFSRQAQRSNRQIGQVSKRLPIHKLLGPSAADAATERRGELDKVVGDLGVILETNLLSQVDRLLNRSSRAK